MDKSIRTIIYIIFILLFVVSCNSQQKTRLEIHNLSQEVIDSIYVGDIFSGKTNRYYNVQINEKIIIEYNYDRSKLPPKGEHSLLGLVVFKKKYYYHNDNGLIGFPMSFIEDNYNFFIYSNGISTTKEFNPPMPHDKADITKFNLYSKNIKFK